MLDIKLSDVLDAILDGGYDIDSLDFLDSLDLDDGGDVL
nr:MAG TPA: hypothetical protein [Caudoviricetes sp.]